MGGGEGTGRRICLGCAWETEKRARGRDRGAGRSPTRQRCHRKKRPEFRGVEAEYEPARWRRRGPRSCRDRLGERSWACRQHVDRKPKIVRQVYLGKIEDLVPPTEHAQIGRGHVRTPGTR